MSYNDFLSSKLSYLKESEYNESLVDFGKDIGMMIMKVIENLSEKAHGVYMNFINILRDKGEFINWLLENEVTFKTVLHMLKPFLATHGIPVPESVSFNIRANMISEGIFDKLVNAPKNIAMMAMFILFTVLVEPNLYAGETQDIFNKIKDKSSEIADAVKDKVKEVEKSDIYKDMKDKAGDIGDEIGDKADELGDKIRPEIEKGKDQLLNKWRQYKQDKLTPKPQPVQPSPPPKDVMSI